MFKSYWNIWFFVLISALVGISGDVYAQNGGRSSNSLLPQSSSNGKSFLSLDEAVIRVQERSGGKILSASEVEDDSGKILYRIKYLASKGVVRTVFVDPFGGKKSKKNRRR